MASWFLILIFVGFKTGAAIETVPMGSEAACRAAIDAVQGRPPGSGYGYLTAVCVPSGLTP